MTTIANNVASKLAVAFVAIAMMFSLVAPAQAQTAEELQAQIDTLMATITALQSQLGVSGGEMVSASAVCPYTWTRSLNMGDTGADVMKLQQFLNADTATRVAASGPGSVGAETSYYGPATGAAVAKFQEMYRAEILSPLGLVNSTTFFGNSTRAQANALCVAAPVVEEEEEEEAEEGEEEEAGSKTLGNDEGSIDSVDEVAAEESNIDEGQTAGIIAADVTIEGDVEINRVDFYIEETTGGGVSNDPEDYFVEASLWVDGDKVATVDVDEFDEDDYDVVSNDAVEEFRIRFSGLDLVFEDGDEPEFQLAFEVLKNLDSADITGADWDVVMEGIRYVDGQGFTDTDTTSIVDSFGFSAEEIADIDVTESSDSPDGTTVEVDTDDTSGEIEIMVLEIEESNGVDATIEDITMTASTTNGDVTTTIDEVVLYVDGEEVGSDSPTAGGLLVFENLGIEVGADETVEVTAKIVFNGTDDYAEGDSVYLVFTEITDAEDENGNDEADFGNYPFADVTSDTFTLRSEGLVLDIADITETKDAASFSGDTDTGTFVFEIDVEAFGANFYMDDDSTVVDFDLLVGGVVAPAASSTATLDISGATDGATSDYKIAKNKDGITLTLTVETDSSVSGSAKVRVNSVDYSAADDGTEELTENAVPANDWTSSSLILN